MSSTLLTGCHNHHLSLSQQFLIVIMSSSLLQSFSEDKWMSIHWLPYLCIICFHDVLERLFTQLTLALWGKPGANFITNVGRRAMNAEITPLAFLVMDGVGEGKLGMITAFCRSDQAKLNLQMHF